MIHIYTPGEALVDSGMDDVYTRHLKDKLTRLTANAILVDRDGRVTYFCNPFTKISFADLSPERQAIFEAIIAAHRLDITTLESEYAPFVWDISLAHTPALPPGAQLWGKGGAA